MTDNIIDRDELQDNLINQILDDMDIKTMMAVLYDNMSNSYDSYSVDELIEEVKEYYPHILEESNTNWVSRRWTVGQVAHKIGTGSETVYCRCMNKTPYTDPCTYALQEDMRQLKEMIASDLSQYMLEMMPDLNDCVDWVCDRFALDATDELIDFVADCHDEFFGNWHKPLCP